MKGISKMRNIPEPYLCKPLQEYKNIIKRKRNVDYKKVLDDNKFYVKKRYTEYFSKRYELKYIKKSVIHKKEDKDTFESCFNSSFTSNMKKINLKEVCNTLLSVCPLCDLEKYDELDHYLPKALYPEYTLLPINLIPSCGKCNGKKLSNFVNEENKNREILNFYYDVIPKEKFLCINFSYISSDPLETLKIKYSLDLSGINHKLSTIINNHFSKLNLLNRYSEEAINIISIIYTNCRWVESLSIEHIKPYLTGELNELLINNGVNHWKVQLLKNIINSTFLEDLVNFININKEVA